MENKDIDKLFREVFSDAQENPPNDMWSKIESSLDEEKKVIPLKRSTAHVYKYAAAAVIALGLIFSTYKFLIVKDNKLSPSVIAEKNNKAIEKTQSVITYDSTLKVLEKKQPLQNKLAALPQSSSEMTGNKKLTNSRELVSIEEIKVPSLAIDLDKQPHSITALNVSVNQVTEVDDIKPLIEPEEETESMYASSQTKHQSNSNVVTTILNTLSENIEVSDTKDIRFRADEEGSLRIEIFNSLVKNRIKKRK